MNMIRNRYETGLEPIVTVAECLGDLIVKGWSDPAVLVYSDRCTVDEKEKGLAITSESRLTVRVPVGASLLLHQVRGNLIVKGVDGELAIGEVNGSVVLKGVGAVQVEKAFGSLTAKNVDGTLQADQVMHALSLRNVGDLALGTVHGDFSARYVDGDVKVTEVHGDVSLKTVSGDLTLGQCAGDANLVNLGGALNVEQVAGDARLTGSLAPGKHSLRATGDIVVRWPPEAPINLMATASNVQHSFPFDTTNQESGTFMGALGEGDVQLVLEAQGDVSFKAYREAESEWDFDEGDLEINLDATLDGLQRTISAKLDSQLTDMSERLRQQFGPEFSTKMARKAEKAVEHALKRVEQAQQRARYRYGPPEPARPTPAKSRKASSEEQLKVLQMLEKGVISVEEATTLLEALES
jgi:hypothetical protein